MPAGLNGCVGIKPTRGMITTTGVVPAAASYDCVTVLARSVPDAALVVKIMQVSRPGNVLLHVTEASCNHASKSSSRM